MFIQKKQALKRLTYVGMSLVSMMVLSDAQAQRLDQNQDRVATVRRYTAPAQAQERLQTQMHTIPAQVQDQNRVPTRIAMVRTREDVVRGIRRTFQDTTRRVRRTVQDALHRITGRGPNIVIRHLERAREDTTRVATRLLEDTTRNARRSSEDLIRSMRSS